MAYPSFILFEEEAKRRGIPWVQVKIELSPDPSTPEEWEEEYNYLTYEELDCVMAFEKYRNVEGLRKIEHPSEAVKKFLEDYDKEPEDPESFSYEVDHPVTIQRY